MYSARFFIMLYVY